MLFVFGLVLQFIGWFASIAVWLGWIAVCCVITAAFGWVFFVVLVCLVYCGFTRLVCLLWMFRLVGLLCS